MTLNRPLRSMRVWLSFCSAVVMCTENSLRSSCERRRLSVGQRLTVGSGTVEPYVLDLVEQGSIADPEPLGGLDAVPARVLEDLGDRLALGAPCRLARDVLE